VTNSGKVTDVDEDIILKGCSPRCEDGIADLFMAEVQPPFRGKCGTTAEAVLEMQKLHFSILAHELNNFLHCIQNSIYMAKDGLKDNSGEVESLLEYCERAAYNSVHLVRNYSMFIKGGAGNCEASEVDVVDIARTSAKMLLHDKRINFLFRTDNNAEYVFGGETQLYQLFFNLLKNAKEAMVGNRITIKIDISRTSIGTGHPDSLMPGEYSIIKITDSGAGIDRHSIQYLFDPYFTSKKTGTGLGLLTCLWIVKSHKGVITVDSEIGKGTIFTILLPVCARY